MAQRLRLMLDRGEFIVAPGAYDPIGARIVETLGFPSVYVAGFMVAAHLGMPEPELGLADLLAVAGRIAGVVDIPVICDAGSGYGSSQRQIQASVRAFEDASVAGIHIEDEIYPRPSSRVHGIARVQSLSAFERRLQWAMRARRDSNFVIMARTDVIDVGAGDRDEVVRRGQMAARIGASAFAVKGLTSKDDLGWLRAALPNVPLLAWAGKHSLTTADYEKLGVQIVGYALAPITAAVGSLWDNYAALKRTGLPGIPAETMLKQRKLVFDLVGLDETGALRQPRR